LLSAATSALGQAGAAAAAPIAASTIAAAAVKQFDVASVRPSAPLDMAKLQADVQAGKMPNFGIHINGLRAEYNYTTLKALIASAYNVKEYQVSGPDWLANQRFDIVATMPPGSTKDDAPAMLQSLLADRFKLATHRETQDHPVLALIVGKGGPRLKESPAAPEALDPDAPLKSGEMKMEGPDGPIRITTHPDGTITENMGAKGTAVIKVDGMTLHMETDTMTMSGFADMLTGILQMGGTGGRTVIDKTGLKGNYQVAVDMSMADLIAAAQAQGLNLQGGGAAGGASGGAAGGAGSAPAPGTAAAQASDPGGGGSSVYSSVEKLGLKLEPAKAPVEQIIVDSAQRSPTEN
jgi:uncharacterized protein (TIGR03435 family)